MYTLYFCTSVQQLSSRLNKSSTEKKHTRAFRQKREKKKKKLKHKTVLHFVYFNLIFILFFILQFNNITHVIEYNYFDLVKNSYNSLYHSSKTQKETEKLVPNANFRLSDRCIGVPNSVSKGPTSNTNCCCLHQFMNL